MNIENIFNDSENFQKKEKIIMIIKNKLDLIDNILNYEIKMNENSDKIDFKFEFSEYYLDDELKSEFSMNYIQFLKLFLIILNLSDNDIEKISEFYI